MEHVKPRLVSISDAGIVAESSIFSPKLFGTSVQDRSEGDQTGLSELKIGVRNYAHLGDGVGFFEAFASCAVWAASSWPLSDPRAAVSFRTWLRTNNAIGFM